jgi:putative Holliday junction resolvase
MRILGIDVGARRVGLAVSDVTGTIARPLETLIVSGAGSRARQVAAVIARLRSEEDGLDAVVVGMPRRLDGTPTAESGLVARFVNTLRALTPLPVVAEDERLSSVEAEHRLAGRERDWRKRKARLDAAAAAVILQDYLDRRPPHESPLEPE